MRILVAYATVHGSTAEVARKIADVLTEQGNEGDCIAAQEVADLERYDAVVLGTSLYMFAPHAHAKRFVARFKDQIAHMPLALFGLGPFEDIREQYISAAGHLDKLLAPHPQLRTRARTVFGGAWNPEVVRFPFSLIPALRSMPASDVRHWDEIEAWARDLPAQLG